MPANVVSLYCHLLVSGLKKLSPSIMDSEVQRGLAAARLYSVPAGLYEAMYSEAEHQLRSRVAASSRIDATALGGVDPFFAAVQDVARSRPFMGPAPFDSCFFCYARPIPLTRQRSAIISGIDPTDPPAVDATTIAHMVSREVDGWLIHEFVSSGGETWVLRTHAEGRWRLPVDCEVLAVPALVALVMHAGASTYTPLSNPEKRECRLAGKRNGRTIKPGPYYLITVDVPSARRSAGRRMARALRHRETPVHSYDQRGTTRLRLIRGCFDRLDLKLVRRLSRRGYVIHTIGPIEARWARELDRRGLDGLRPGEFLAMLLRPVGPGRKYRDLPYLPALRTLGVGCSQRPAKDLHAPGHNAMDRAAVIHIDTLGQLNRLGRSVTPGDLDPLAGTRVRIERDGDAPVVVLEADELDPARHA